MARFRLLLTASLLVALTACTAPPAAPKATNIGAGNPERLTFRVPSQPELLLNLGEKASSPDWATAEGGVDPNSAYGLHRLQGLEPIARPELRPLAESETAAITGLEILNKDACLSKNPSHPQCRYRVSFSALPSGVVVGSVLNAGITPNTPTGLLVKVTSVDGNRVEAVQAGLEDALKQGEFRLEKALLPSDIRGTPTLNKGVAFVTPEAGAQRSRFVKPLGEVQASLPGALSIDVEPIDGVRIQGTLDFGIGCGIDGGVDWSHWAWVELGCNAWEEASIKVTAQVAGQKDFQYPIALVPLAVIPIPVGPLVVVVVVDIEVTVDLHGRLNVNLSYEGRERAEVWGAVRMCLHHGLSHNGGINSTGGSDGVKISGDVSVWAAGNAAVRASLYGVLGVNAGASAYVVLDYGPLPDAIWTMKANARVFAGVFLGILGYDVSAEISYKIGADYTIGRGERPGPELEILSPKPAQVVDYAPFGVSLSAKATSYEGQTLPVTWEENVTREKVTSSGTATMLLSPGVHLMKVSATDSLGVTTTKYVSFTVKPAGVGLGLTLLKLDGTALPSPPSSPQGIPVLVKAAITSKLISPPDCSAIKWAATNATVASDGSCVARVTPTAQGTATVTASVTDYQGTTGNAQIAFKVTAPPAVTPPLFDGILLSSGSTALTSGDSIYGGQPLTMRVNYLNYAAAGITPVYTWSANYPLVVVSDSVTSSLRSYTPTNAYANITLNVTCVITDQATGKVLATLKATISWIGLPR